MRILHIHDSLILGGIPAGILAVARGMAASGVESEFYFRQVRDARAGAEYERDFKIYTSQSRLLRSVIATGDFDCVRMTIWVMHFAVPALLSAGFRGPAVLSSHQAVPTDPIEPRIDRVVAVSRAGAAAVVNPHGKLVEIILNGVDTRRFAPPGVGDEIGLTADPSGDRPIILWIGRVQDWMKGFPLFLAVASAMRHEDVDFWGVYSDDYPAAGGLVRALPRLTLTRGIPFDGMPEVYRKVNRSQGCLLVTSFTECCPNMVLEALSSGCPVVGARVGGVPELVEHGRTGLLFDSGASIDEVAASIRAACAPDAWPRLAAAAREHAVRELDVTRTAARYVALFRKLKADCEGRHPLTLRQQLVRHSLPPREWFRSNLGLRAKWI